MPRGRPVHGSERSEKGDGALAEGEPSPWLPTARSSETIGKRGEEKRAALTPGCKRRGVG